MAEPEQTELTGFITLEKLSEAWNALRNAALGRGTKPNVPPVLAAEVSRTYDQWRAWYTSQDPIVMPQDIAEGVEWVQRYRKLLSKVHKAGATPAAILPKGLIETVQENTAALGRSIAWGLVGTGVGIALFVLARSKRGGRD